MNTLWMDEDELRAEVERLNAELCVASVMARVMFARIREVGDYAYRCGYSDAAMGISPEVEARDAGGLVLH